MNLLTAIGIIFSLCFSLVSCQKSSDLTNRRPRQELQLVCHSEPPTLDPRKGTDTTSISLINMCFEGLMRLDKDGKPNLAVAKSVEISENKKTYIFTLQETKWSDGKPVTSYDFSKNWLAMLDPAFPSPLATDLYIIKNAKAAKENHLPLNEVGIQALDPKTLKIDLEHPVPHFLDLIASHTFLPVPAHIVNAHSNWADHGGALFVGNGPFTLKTWRHYNEMLFEKNIHYWDASHVKLEKIQISIIEDENTELSLYENGAIDWAGSPLSTLPLDALQVLVNKKDMHTYPMSGTYYYVFNTKIPPFNNKNFRKAFSIAINRMDIINHVIQGKQSIACGLVPKTMWKGLFSSACYFKDGDIEEARRLFKLALKEMKMKPSDLPKITLSYNTLAAHHKIAQAIQGQWMDAFGIEVSLENKEWKVFLNELVRHQFQVARLGGIASINDPIDFLDTYREANDPRNYSQWSQPEYRRLLEKADLTADQNERFEILKQAENILIEEMPIAPIYFYTGSYLKKPYVHGIYLSQISDIDFKSAYLEPMQK